MCFQAVQCPSSRDSVSMLMLNTVKFSLQGGEVCEGQCDSTTDGRVYRPRPEPTSAELTDVRWKDSLDDLYEHWNRTPTQGKPESRYPLSMMEPSSSASDPGQGSSILAEEGHKRKRDPNPEKPRKTRGNGSTISKNGVDTDREPPGNGKTKLPDDCVEWLNNKIHDLLQLDGYVVKDISRVQAVAELWNNICGEGKGSKKFSESFKTEMFKLLQPLPFYMIVEGNVEENTVLALKQLAALLVFEPDRRLKLRIRHFLDVDSKDPYVPRTYHFARNVDNLREMAFAALFPNGYLDKLENSQSHDIEKKLFSLIQTAINPTTSYVSSKDSEYAKGRRLLDAIVRFLIGELHRFMDSEVHHPDYLEPILSFMKDIKVDYSVFKEQAVKKKMTFIVAALENISQMTSARDFIKHFQHFKPSFQDESQSKDLSESATPSDDDVDDSAPLVHCGG